ncbi:MAG TPA: hypothetical protein PKG52_02015 [bacterium]|nr:hypothetical protein [bacterium]HPS29090.1 hypothetical protein [bacterium]
MKDIVFIGGVRDYHIMDWYRTVKKTVSDRKVVILTDLIKAEGFDVLTERDDVVEKLFIIDRFLFKNQSSVGNIWRNIVKLIVLPIQILYLRKFARKNRNCVFHANPMYYMLLCWLSGINFVGTPQGSEILVRPGRSKLYRYFAVKALKSARIVTVDSESMKKEIFEMSGVNAIVVQNGIDVAAVMSEKESSSRIKVASVRGMTDLYRIKEILWSRNFSKTKQPINFAYPFHDDEYKKELKGLFIEEDKDLGRLSKEEFYKVLRESFLVISVPKSDSSPRSVYEAIFSGCCVAVTYNNYVEVLPECMKKRLYIVDILNENWLEEAVKYARGVAAGAFSPSEAAIEMFDQDRTIKRVINMLY